MERVAWQCTEKPNLAVTFLGGCTGIYMMQGVRERESRSKQWEDLLQSSHSTNIATIVVLLATQPEKGRI